MYCVITIITILAGIHAFKPNMKSDEEWKKFMATYNKKYSSLEEEHNRRAIFHRNKQYVEQHNEKFARGESTFKLAINKFADLERKEFARIMNGFKGKKARMTTLVPVGECGNETEYLDYREKGAVTPIKDQGMCGSCWAFSTTGALEGAHFLKTGKPVSLSEQNLVDCTLEYGNFGCSGGWMDNAFQYIIDNKGIDTEEAYPYMQQDLGYCNFTKDNVGSRQLCFVDLPSGNEDALKDALCSAGPISVAIDASNDSFMLYHSGIYDEVCCTTYDLDHAVLVVGFGTFNETGQDYWIVKNSWGKDWGEDGYIRMSRNKDNQCGIATAASYPLV